MCSHQFLFRVNALERRESQFIRIADVKVPAICPEAKRKQTHTLVKGEIAGVFITTKLRGQERQQGGFPRAGWPKMSVCPRSPAWMLNQNGVELSVIKTASGLESGG